ncbi:DUF6706 family protein [Pedobacter faecalis]|uniref:DUF6706 family protein n=1 Tax=Pedobacter faecalis TaxID=3041495 RepID=UPI00254DB6FE|nr:DUF6706 family protein [Pedobacter sp. ELA7]
MTIKEALSTKTEQLTLASGALDLAILESGLDGTATYDPGTNGKDVDLVWAGLLLTVIQVTEVREDDASVKYAGNLREIYSAIMRKWGLVDPFAAAKPTVRQRVIW